MRDGDAERALELLERGGEGIDWIPEPEGAGCRGAPCARMRWRPGRRCCAAAAAGDGPAALAALERFRILCAHRRGPYGVSMLTARVLGWLEAALPGFAPEERFFLGRPLLLTENDRELGLFNGDTGVVVRAAEDRLGGGVRAPGRGGGVQPGAARRASTPSTR